VPKVSVIIPTYQYAHFVGQAVESVLAQTYKNYEIILVDDGSTDNTSEVLSNFGDQISVIYHRENRGLSAARNAGIRVSKGKYVAFLDADDVWMPNKLRLQVKLLDQNSDVGLVFSDMTYFGKRCGSKKRAFQEVSPSSGKVFKDLFVKDFIPMPTVIVRKICFEKVGLFDESLTSCEDHDMWVRIAKFFKVDYVDAPLAKYRLHERNMSKKREKMLIQFIRVQEKTLKSNPYLLSEVGSTILNRCYKNLGKFYLGIGERKKARRHFLRYVKLYPYNLSTCFFLLLTFLPSLILVWLKKWKDKIGVNP